MIFIVFLSALIFPILFLLNLPPSTQQVIAASGFGIAAFITATVLFVPKIHMLISGHDIASDLKLRAKDSRKGQKSMRVSPSNETPLTVRSPGAVTPASVYRGDADSVYLNCDYAMKGLSEEAKAKLCVDQINKWQAALLRLGEDSSQLSISSKLSDVNNLASNIPASIFPSRLNSVIEEDEVGGEEEK